MNLQHRLLTALVVAVTVALATIAPASASPVVLRGSNSWNTWGPASSMARTLAPVAQPFWDNRSYDGNDLANVGYFISGTPGSDVPNFYRSSPGAYMPYLGDGATTFGVNFTEPTDISHLFSVTDWNDEFGLFDLATDEHFALFRAKNTIGLTHTSFAPGSYGFYLVNGNGQTWYSTTLDRGRSHFAVFQGEDRWYMGVEDATYTSNLTADWDYNDMLVRWAAPEHVPEVGSMSMLGLALLSVSAARRRWRK